MPRLFVVTMPRVESRKDWERIKKAGGRKPQTLGPPLFFCASCTVGVGRAYVQREAYLLPVVRLRKHRPAALTWKSICGYCARDEYHLSSGYQTIHDFEWEAENDEALHTRLTHQRAYLEAYLLTHWPTAASSEELNRLLLQLNPEIEAIEALDPVLDTEHVVAASSAA